MSHQISSQYMSNVQSDSIFSLKLKNLIEYKHFFSFVKSFYDKRDWLVFFLNIYKKKSDFVLFKIENANTCKE